MILWLLACAEEPSVRILTPTEGAVVCGEPLAVEIEVEGLVLVDPTSTADEPGTGHADVMLNGQDALMSDQETFEISGVVPGEYQLKVELSGADHEPIEPYAGDFVYIEVSEDACS